MMKIFRRQRFSACIPLRDCSVCDTQLSLHLH